MNEEQLRIMQMAFEVTGLKMDLAAVELFCMVKDTFDKKNDLFDLRDACKIRAVIQGKYGKKNIMYTLDLLDKV